MNKQLRDLLDNPDIVHAFTNVNDMNGGLYHHFLEVSTDSWIIAVQDTPVSDVRINYLEYRVVIRNAEYSVKNRCRVLFREDLYARDS